MRGSIPALQIAFHGAFYALCLLLHVQGSANATPEVSDGIGVWNKSQVYSKGVFQLESVSEKLCLSAGLSGLSLTSCEPPSSALLWKWVTRHRLFNLGTSRCLGLNATDFLHPVVSMYECDIPLPTMWWRCGTGMLFGAMNNKLAVVNSKVVVRKATLYQWRIFGAAGESPCAYPYEDIHTLQGNSHGMACSIPFKYNNKWFWDCTSEGREDRHLWCATTNRYDQDEKWGFCPNSVSGCNEFWEGHPELDACYQFNLYSILTWNQALTSCQAQGGSLLSISSSDEQNYIKERLIDVGVVVWMGLNHLSLHGGWQWSDRCPLTLVSYTADLSSRPVHQTQQCGVFNSTGGLWQSLSCESALPYICKKTIQRSWNVEPFEFWQYKDTVCPDGWMEHNGFCYQYVDEKASWDGSLSACRTREADLVSIHSLSQQELLLKLLSNVSNSKVWIGLYKETKLPSVQWSDKTPITFTSWSSLEPSSPKEGKRLCVAADVKHGRWQIVDCEETFPSVCKTTGLVTQHATGEQDEGCPEGWNRKDGWCYKIADQEQTFEDAVKGYYCKAPLVTIENRFEQAFLNSLISQSNRSAFYWTALQDRNRTGEYSWLTQNGSSVTVSYTNWNQYQPVTGGGCVVMSGGKALGHWEVKNCVTFKALAVCKQEVSDYQNTLMPSPHVDVQTSCPAGWDSNAHLADCYKVYHSEKILMHRSWTEAQLFCRALGAELASFHHYEDQAFVKKLLSTMFLSTEGRWFWVGFTKRNPQTDGAWEWSDGTPVVASFIEDMNVGDTQTCAVYSDLTNTLIPQSCDFTFEWICKVPKGVDLVKPYWYSDQHFPWVFFRGAEYYFGSKPFPWETVAFSCKMMGADLLSIHSGDELDFVRERIKKGPDYWWIGLSANSAHNGVSWTDGSALDYENWEKTTLGRKYGQNCIYMSSVSGQWSAGRCEDPYGFVCKRMTVTLVEIPRETHYIGSCPENWFYYGNKCLYLHLPARSEEGKSWTESQSICVSNHGSLVSIEDEIEQAYIVMLLNGQTAGVWIGAEGAGSHKWTNGRSINFRNWETSETFNVPEEPRCTYLSNSGNVFLTGMWQDDVCSETIYGFVCQKTQDITKRPTQPFFIASSLDSTEYKNQTYQLIHGNLSWYAAQEGCREKGAELVSITNPFQQAYLTVLVNRLDFPLWIGLYSADDGASYQWSDGSEPSFIHSEVRDDSLGEPGQGGCVYLNVYGRWKGCDCDRPLSGAICSKSPPKKITCTSGVVCPDNWVKFQRSCYNFESVMLEMTLEESIDHCEKKGNFSKVLTVQDEEESRFLLKEMWNYQQGPQNLWLGIIYNADDDTLAELDDSPLHYTNWHSKPPDASVMRAGTCVTMRVTDVAWQLADCKNRLGFICKTSKGGAKEVEVEPLKGLHQSVISVAAVVAVVLFAVMIGSLWLVYKRNSMSIRRLSTFGSAYYRQTNSQASDQDENVLLPDIETSAGD